MCHNRFLNLVGRCRYSHLGGRRFIDRGISCPHVQSFAVFLRTARVAAWRHVLREARSASPRFRQRSTDRPIIVCLNQPIPSLLDAVIIFTLESRGLSSGDGRHHLFDATPSSYALSSIASAISCFDRRFSSSCAFNRRASETSDRLLRLPLVERHAAIDPMLATHIRCRRTVAWASCSQDHKSRAETLTWGQAPQYLFRDWKAPLAPSSHKRP
jgi:hypothetical protein